MGGRSGWRSSDDVCKIIRETEHAAASVSLLWIAGKSRKAASPLASSPRAFSLAHAVLCVLGRVWLFAHSPPCSLRVASGARTRRDWREAKRRRRNAHDTIGSPHSESTPTMQQPTAKEHETTPTAPMPLRPRPQPSTAAIPNPAQRRRATTHRATLAEKAGAAARGAEASPARQWQAHQAQLEQAKAKKQLQQQRRQQPGPQQTPQQQPPSSSSSSSSFAPSSVAAVASQAFGLFSQISSQIGEFLLPNSAHTKGALSGATIVQRHQQQLRAQQPPGHVRELQRQQRREASREHAAAAAAALRHAGASDSEEFSSGNRTEIEEEEDEVKTADPLIRSETPPRTAALAWAPDAPSDSVPPSQSVSSLPQAPCEFAAFGCESLVHADRGKDDPHYSSAAQHHISLLQLKFALIASQRTQLQQDVDAQHHALHAAHEHTLNLENRLRVQSTKLQQARATIQRQKAVLEEVQALRLRHVQDLVSTYAGQPPLDAKSMLRSQRKQLESLRAQLSAKDSLLLELAGLLKNTRLGPHILAKMQAAEHTHQPAAASSAVAVATKKQPLQKQRSEHPLIVLPSSNSPTSMFASMVAAAARRPPPPALALPAPVPAPKLKPQQAISALAQRKLLEQSKPSSLLMRSLVASLTGDPSTQAAESGFEHPSFGKENDFHLPPGSQQQQKQQQQRELEPAVPRVFGPAVPTPQQQETAARSSRRNLRRSLLSTPAEVEDDGPIPLMSEAELIALLPKDGSRVPRPIWMPDPDRPIVDNSQLPWEDYDGTSRTKQAQRATSRAT